MIQNIETRFGAFENIKMSSYGGNEVYSLSEIEGSKEGEYFLLGFEAPVPDDNQWKFWVEKGYSDGSAETVPANLSLKDEQLIKQLYFDYKQERCTSCILDKYAIQEKLEAIYEAQEKYHALMAEFERGMRFIFKEYDIPYFSLDNIVGTRGEGIESVGLAMTELGKEMEKVGLDWENDDLDKEY